jgi:transposase-like protein
MTKAIARDPIYRRRRFQPEIIELCVRWYLTYRLSYRDLVEMMAERGIAVSHSTILRWVQRYVPEFEKRWSRYSRSVHSSWRMDETAVPVRGGHHYLYRAVDKYGKTVDSLLCTDRSDLSARAFFCKALKTHHPRWPTKLNLDGNAASHRALRLLQHESPHWRLVEIRSRRYLNNIVEQDHRAIKRRCAQMLAMKSFRTAAITLAGIELAHRIRKRQFTFGSRSGRQPFNLKHAWAHALACNDDLTGVDRDCTRTQRTSAC